MDELFPPEDLPELFEFLYPKDGNIKFKLTHSPQYGWQVFYYRYPQTPVVWGSNAVEVARKARHALQHDPEAFL